MVQHTFKRITAVPTARDFIDIVLSKTQRQTPTVVHPGYAIHRIRQFYMRKVRYTQQSTTERLAKILEDFPRLDDVHPFYADLINVLYDRDHYKLALGQVNGARTLIENVGKDYVRLLKFGDSLYRCKQLKRAALGRMCTGLKKLTASLAYLEQVRQHMARLPSIDPNTRTLLICGYPNVGKSSFLNTVTRANVEVQPYAFTTKSLYVGHMDYKYLRWQVIDTPGVLDRPLEERNTVEMQSITALAHLRAAVLYIVDLSEQCGWSLAQQIQLFNSIQPLFANKPLFVVVNKIDIRGIEDLQPEEREMLESVRACGAEIMTMSTATGQGITELKSAACELLLEKRVEQKLNSSKIDGVVNRIHVAEPTPRDNKTRPASIPAGATDKKTQSRSHKLEKELMVDNGGAGVYAVDVNRHYLLGNEDWKYDRIPEIMDGMNIADFVDPDILKRLEELDREEMVAANTDADMEEPVADLTEEQQAVLAAIRKKKSELIVARRTRGLNPLPRSRAPMSSADKFEDHLLTMGIRMTDQARGRLRERSLSRRSASRALSTDSKKDAAAEEDSQLPPRKRTRSESRASAMSVTSVQKGEGYRNVKQKTDAIRKARKAQVKANKLGRQGEGDRHISVKLPKHLFSGKRGIGKTDRR